MDGGGWTHLKNTFNKGVKERPRTLACVNSLYIVRPKNIAKHIRHPYQYIWHRCLNEPWNGAIIALSGCTRCQGTHSSVRKYFNSPTAKHLNFLCGFCCEAAEELAWEGIGHGYAGWWELRSDVAKSDLQYIDIVGIKVNRERSCKMVFTETSAK